MAATLVIAATVWLSLRGLARVVVPGVTRDASAPLVGPRVRAWYRGVLEPLEDALVGARVHPDALTFPKPTIAHLPCKRGTRGRSRQARALCGAGT